MNILERIQGHEDLVRLSQVEQAQLCDELRQFLVSNVALKKRLSFLTAPVGRRPEELDQEAFARMMEAVRRTFDICLLDAPAGVVRSVGSASWPIMF